MVDLRQTELDLFEEQVLTRIFGSTEIKVNPLLRGFLADRYGIKSVEDTIQQIIDVFENVTKPVMYDNGIVSASMLAEKIRVMFPQFSNYIEFIPKQDFRLVDMLGEINLQNLIQKLIGVK